MRLNQKDESMYLKGVFEQTGGSMQDTKELTQFGEDIWITDRPVLPHTDSTAEGMLTYGLILINTGYTLIYDGKEIPIPVGSMYEIDGRKEHQTIGSGLLVVLIWDMPNYSLEEFKEELRNDPRNFLLVI